MPRGEPGKRVYINEVEAKSLRKAGAGRYRLTDQELEKLSQTVPLSGTETQTVPSKEVITVPFEETVPSLNEETVPKAKLSHETVPLVIVLSDGQVYHPPSPDSSLSPSKAYPRQPGKCIRCGGRIPASDNFCSDPHYKEHLAWLESRLKSGQEAQEGASDGGGGMIHPRVLALKGQLEDLKARYTLAQKRQDWMACDKVNEEREPLLKELFKLTKGQSRTAGWFPARFY